MNQVLLVGLGGIGFEYDLYQSNSIETHAKALTLSSDYQLIAAVDLNKQKLQKFKSHFPGVKTHSKIGNVFEEAPNINIAVVSVPTDKHLDALIELQIFKNIKYIILEKPAGKNLCQGKKNSAINAR